MALRAVPEHPKFARLKRTLKLSKCPTLGYLEGLWHFAGKFTPHGDLGKYPDEEIECWLEWDGEPGVLIAALVLCGWIDRHGVHRLVIHDWHQHADDATKLAVKRSGRDFVARVSPQCSDSVPNCSDSVLESGTRTRLPEPVPEPVPVPGPGPGPEKEQTTTPPPAAPESRASPTPNLSLVVQASEAVRAKDPQSQGRPVKKRKHRANASKPYHPRFEAAYGGYPKLDEKVESEAEWHIAVQRLMAGEKARAPMTEDDAQQLIEDAVGIFAPKMANREWDKIRSMRRWLKESNYLDNLPPPRREPVEVDFEQWSGGSLVH